MRETLSGFCARTGRDALLGEWDAERNAPLTPNYVSYGSHEKVWWRCAKGHSWQAAVYTRTGSGAECPYCKGVRAWPGENDLATLRPDLAAQWHPTKNEGFTPAEIPIGSHHRAWWICEKGHEWRTAVKSRALDGTGCPVCANRVIIAGQNDLAAQFPDIARQWHPTKNGTLTPEQVGSGAHRKVWWQCEKGHEWRSSVSSRTGSGAGCPYCAGKLVITGETDLATLFPKTAAEWHTERNGTQTPQTVSANSNRKVWWICPQGHEYQAAVASRTTHGSGCPYCAGRRLLTGFNDLGTVEPKVAEQWHPTLNGNLTPQMVTSGMHRKVWWQCSEGHVWKAAIYSRTGAQKCGCPVCAGNMGKARRERQERYARTMAQAYERRPQTAEHSGSFAG
ncbi:MAG: zinc-ribbon domain-containing protein [Oscillospiraceae bacterium]|nr:zinc-ribbon domain-containing protein [Oscillospiraceae bacterium]